MRLEYTHQQYKYTRRSIKYTYTHHTHTKNAVGCDPLLQHPVGMHTPLTWPMYQDTNEDQSTITDKKDDICSECKEHLAIILAVSLSALSLSLSIGRKPYLVVYHKMALNLGTTILFTTWCAYHMAPLNI